MEPELEKFGGEVYILHLCLQDIYKLFYVSRWKYFVANITLRAREEALP